MFQGRPPNYACRSLNQSPSVAEAILDTISRATSDWDGGLMCKIFPIDSADGRCPRGGEASRRAGEAAAGL